jgi:hypothetical protein
VVGVDRAPGPHLQGLFWRRGVGRPRARAPGHPNRSGSDALVARSRHPRPAPGPQGVPEQDGRRRCNPRDLRGGRPPIRAIRRVLDGPGEGPAETAFQRRSLRQGAGLRARGGGSEGGTRAPASVHAGPPTGGRPCAVASGGAEAAPGEGSAEPQGDQHGATAPAWREVRTLFPRLAARPPRARAWSSACAIRRFSMRVPGLDRSAVSDPARRPMGPSGSGQVDEIYRAACPKSTLCRALARRPLSTSTKPATGSGALSPRRHATPSRRPGPTRPLPCQAAPQAWAQGGAGALKARMGE